MFWQLAVICQLSQHFLKWQLTYTTVIPVVNFQTLTKGANKKNYLQYLWSKQF